MTDTSGPTADAAPAAAPSKPARGRPAPPPVANAWWRPPMRDVLAVASTGMIAFAFVAPIILKAGSTLDPDLKGAVLLQWGAVMGYYFGTMQAKPAPAEAARNAGQ